MTYTTQSFHLSQIYEMLDGIHVFTIIANVFTCKLCLTVSVSLYEIQFTTSKYKCIFLTYYVLLKENTLKDNETFVIV